MTDKNIKFEKNKFNFKQDFDFNELAKMVDNSNFTSEFCSHNVHQSFILEYPMKISNVESYPFFCDFFKFFNENNNENKKRSNIVLFFSFTAGGKGLAHKDEEDVTILGLYGKTLYIVEDNHYIVEKGDVIYIPSGVVHRAIGLSPRIVMSFGVYG